MTGRFSRSPIRLPSTSTGTQVSALAAVWSMELAQTDGSLMPPDVIMGVLVTPRQDLLSKLRFYQNAGGAVPSSFDCWLAQRGLKTLALRMVQHGLNGVTLARWLAKQDWVKEVIYPGLEGSERSVTRALAWRQLSSTAREKVEELGYSEHSGFPYGGMVSFRLDTGRAREASAEAAKVSSDFLASLHLFTLAESLGGVESLAE